jgi:GH15 family glucan-1,4-alpha-glucosidase
VDQPPISDYALLSDCQGAALASRGGAIDWWCAPRFDSRSTFARLLDPAAGHWTIRPEGVTEVTRAYAPGTLVLQTTFGTGAGRVRLTEALALEPGARGHEIGMRSPHAIVRLVEALEGPARVHMRLEPRPEYGLVVPRLEARDGIVRTEGGADALFLRADAPVRIEDAAVVADLDLPAGGGAAFALAHRAGWGPDPEVPEPRAALEDAAAAWRSWSEMHTQYRGAYRDRVRHSALVLQALTYQPTGAIVAAPTTSLPEVEGGELNFDFRFAWLRDAALTLHALWVAACPDEAERNFAWMARAGAGASPDGGVQIMFGVEGERDLTEHELPHLRGYRGSRPVRVGNAAWSQTQLDVYGEVLASAQVLRDQIGEMGDAVRDFLCALADLAARRWEETDAGIWEGREGERHYVSSKVMCWVALDRALDLADALDAGPERRAAWSRERERVREAVLERGWCEEAGAYSGAFGSDHLDASVLLMPLVGFLPADDERMRRTIDTVERELATDGLVRRWTGAEDGGFVICSFWLADCLARAGEVDRARRVFEAVCAHANDVGLLSEEVDPADGRLLGNFPQGFSHVGLIAAAWSIDQAAG